MPQPVCSGSSGVLTLWWTSEISTPPKPASAIWSISRWISCGSTSPCGHHQRNFGWTSRGGLEKRPPRGCQEALCAPWPWWRAVMAEAVGGGGVGCRGGDRAGAGDGAELDQPAAGERAGAGLVEGRVVERSVLVGGAVRARVVAVAGASFSHSSSLLASTAVAGSRPHGFGATV